MESLRTAKELFQELREKAALPSELAEKIDWWLHGAPPRPDEQQLREIRTAGCWTTELECDTDNCVLSEADEGFWVSCWWWVPYPFDEDDCGDCDEDIADGGL